MFACMEDLQYILAVVFWYFDNFFKIFLTLHLKCRTGMDIAVCVAWDQFETSLQMLPVNI